MVEGAVTSGLDARCVVRRGEFRLDAAVRIEGGETVAVLGPNGSGKTTLVEALAGLIPLDAGRILLDGRVLDDPAAGVFVPPEGRRVGVVFQDYLLFPHLSVFENVAFGPRSQGRSRTEVRHRTRFWLERLDVADLGGRRPRDLSGGQRQRVALARALASGPALLLLDEPFAAVDASSRVQLRRALRDHLDGFEGPRLLITHDPTDAFLLADRIFVLQDGSVVQSGTADDIRLRPRTRYVADLVGTNFWLGEASDGMVSVGGHHLSVADRGMAGPVFVTVHPRAVAVYRRRPEGSPRNTWETVIVRIEHHGDRVRLQTGAPLPLTAEVTPGAVSALGLGAGSRVWVSVKATEIGVESA